MLLLLSIIYHRGNNHHHGKYSIYFHQKALSLGVIADTQLLQIFPSSPNRPLHYYYILVLHAPAPISRYMVLNDPHPCRNDGTSMTFEHTTIILSVEISSLP